MSTDNMSTEVVNKRGMYRGGQAGYITDALGRACAPHSDPSKDHHHGLVSLGEQSKLKRNT